MKMISSVSVICSFLLIVSISHAAVQDFCVADYSAPQSPSGYTCKDPQNVTANDFVYSRLSFVGNTSNILKASITSGFSSQFPGVNGLGISMVRVDLAPGGVVPFHSHPRASEILLVVEGNVTAGLISSNNVVYLKNLTKGEIIAFPQGLFHFVVNAAPSQALLFGSFNSENPGIEILVTTLFASDLPTEYIAATAFLDPVEIRRLKALFGGSG